MLSAGALYFFFPDSSGALISQFFATQNLPNGYIWIIGSFLLPLPYFLYSLKHDRQSQIFRLLLVFAVLYTLLFVVAAYGIVWYGIAMYYVFLGMIVIGGYAMTENDGTENTGNMLRFVGSLALLSIVSIYFFRSSIPHGFNNLK